MSIYTAVGIQGGRPSLVFLERELNMAPTTVEGSGIMAIPRPKPSIRYRTVIDWIHVYGASILDKKIYVSRVSTHNVLKRMPDNLPVAPPVLALKLSGTTEADKEELKGWGMTESNQTRGNLWLGKPTLNHFRSLIAKHGLNDEPVPAGNVSPVGYYAFFIGWKAIGLFSIVSNAATNNDGIYFTGKPDGEVTVTKSSTVDVPEIGPVGISGVGEVGMKLFRSPALAPIFSPLKQIATRSDYTWKLTESFVTGGFVLPYFHGLLLPSRDYTGTTFFRHFSSCFCDSETEFLKIAPILRRGFRNLQATRGGMELQHMMFGVDLAITLGGALKPLFEGKQYMGLALTHGQGVILDKNTIREPVDGAKLKELILSLSVHTNNLTKIKTILEKYPMMTGDTELFDIELYRTKSRLLANHLIQRDLSSADTDDILGLREACEKLSFGEEYWAPTAANIKIVLRAMSSGKWLHEDAPYFLGKGCGTSLNLFVRCLAVFGPDVPDIYIGDEVRQIARPGRDDPNLTVKDGARDRLPYIPVYTQPILAAAGHWKAVQTRSQIRFHPSRKGKREFTNRSKVTTDIAGEDFPGFYELLREFIGQKDADDTSGKVDKGKKRARSIGMDVDTEGSVGSSESAKRLKFDYSAAI